MSAGSPGIAGITARIDAIERRFDAGSTRPTQVVDAGAEFEPFGEAYRRALNARSAPVAIAPAAPTTDARARFATELGGVRAAHSSAPVIEARQAHTIGGFGPMPVPPELAGYGNGQIPADRLRPIAQSGHRLHAPASVAWDALVDAAAADGIEMRITDSYRSYEQQVDLARRKGLYRDGGFAATPGKSNHGWGLAVDADVTDPRTLDWIRTNGPRFGWVEAVPREPWHWEFRPHQV